MRGVLLRFEVWTNGHLGFRVLDTVITCIEFNFWLFGSCVDVIIRWVFDVLGVGDRSYAVSVVDLSL